MASREMPFTLVPSRPVAAGRETVLAGEATCLRPSQCACRRGRALGHTVARRHRPRRGTGRWRDGREPRGAARPRHRALRLG